jgi:hypothetical protein
MNPDDIWEDDGGNREYMSEQEAMAAASGQYHPGYQQAPAEPVYASQPEDFMQVYEEEYEDMEDEELEQKTTNVMDNALVRLEQGRLYKMFMDNIDQGMFTDSGCDERSIKNVEREMKAFIMSRIEVLLGIRKVRPQQINVIREEAKPQLDDLELAVIKKITSSAAAKAGIKPVTNSGGIKKIGQPQTQTQQQTTSQPQKPQKKALKKKTKRKPAVQGKVNKPIGQMTREELEARNAQINRQSSARAQQAPVDTGAPAPLPPPTSDQMEMYHTQQAMQNVPMESNSKEVLMKHILTALANKG